MNRHVTHLLSAYAEGQLRPRRAARVYRHVSRCPACREKLARHERLAADLRLTLGQSAGPDAAQVEAWWRVIQGKQARPLSGPVAAAVLPVLLSLLLLVLPVTLGLNGWQAHPSPGAEGTPAVLPVVAAALLDPPQETYGEGSAVARLIASPVPTDAVATPAPDHASPPVEPVPSAPPAPQE